MTAKLPSLALAIAALAAFGVPANAADWGSSPSYGGTKDSGSAAVPVPAPVPVPVYEATWYFRADVSLGYGPEADGDETGLILGDERGGYAAADPYGTPDDWLRSNDEHHTMWGVGIGYRYSDRLRGDVTLESRREQSVTIRGEQQSPLVNTDTGETLDGGSYHEATVRDNTSVRGAVTLFNAYYDFANWGRFTPYIGGGVGFGYNRIKRDAMVREVAHDECCGTTSTLVDETLHDGKESVTFAAAATVGLSYSLSEYFDLDFAYRYLHIGGTDMVSNFNGYTSRITIDDTNDHQFRAGVRWNVY